MLYGSITGMTPDDYRALQADLQGELDAIAQYGAHVAATQNAMLRSLWERIRHDEVRHAHWLQMALSGHIPGSGMGPMGGQASVPGGTFSPGQVVVPIVAHLPKHVDRAARILDVTREPVYVLDFGDGVPHRWYVQSELRLAPTGTVAGQQVPGATVEEMPH